MRLISSLKPNRKKTRRQSFFKMIRNRISLCLVIIAPLAVFIAFSLSNAGADWIESKINIIENHFMELTASAGLKVDSVNVVGRKSTHKDDLIRALGIKIGTPIFQTNLKHAQERLELLGWIKTASISRKLPNEIWLNIIERKPLAVWQHKQKIFLIDSEGEVIQRKNLATFDYLPTVVGIDAAETAAFLLDLINLYPSISNRLKSAQRVSKRRWNLYFKNGLVIKLPKEKLASALDHLSKVNKENNLFERQIISIDLRIQNRMTVRLDYKAKKVVLAEGENT